MSVYHQIFSNLYQDSVSLMQISAKISATAGIKQASVVMGTAANLQRLQEAGFGEISAHPADLVIAVIGEESAFQTALAQIKTFLEQKDTAAEHTDQHTPRYHSSEQVRAAKPETNLALISVPGQYAVAETIKALNLGLNVMLFSDNIPREDELTIKQWAEKKDRIVMGPDCGTAIINSVPLGFANAVRAGEIGVVAASGTGLQEVTCRIHALGVGISQAIGTGGHDLDEKIGGISMLRGLQALADDAETKVIVLVSKPPAPPVAEKILSYAREAGKPVVVLFLGANPATSPAANITFADSLAAAAEKAVALLTGHSPTFEEQNISLPPLPAGRQYLRAVFAGGTFCYEAQFIAQKYGITAASNIPIAGNSLFDKAGEGKEHLILDMGDDLFTQGRPHPMIDPTLRNERLAYEAGRPDTAVILFDVVLGYGAAEEPLADLLPIITAAQQQPSAPIFIAHVCGTDQDRQNRAAICQTLRAAGVMIAEHNAAAAELAARLVGKEKSV